MPEGFEAVRSAVHTLRFRSVRLRSCVAVPTETLEIEEKPQSYCEEFVVETSAGRADRIKVSLIRDMINKLDASASSEARRVALFPRCEV